MLVNGIDVFADERSIPFSESEHKPIDVSLIRLVVDQGLIYFLQNVQQMVLVADEGLLETRVDDVA